jgi:hypothetical protein
MTPYEGQHGLHCNFLDRQHVLMSLSTGTGIVWINMVIMLKAGWCDTVQNSTV